MGYTPPFLQKLGFDQTESVTVPPGSGDVVGPASATDGHLVVFDGTTGKLVKDGGAVPTGGDSLPDQAGHAGEYLTTDGANVSWAGVAASGGATVLYGTTKAEAPDPVLYGEQTFIWFRNEAALAIWDLVGGIAKWREIGGSVGGNKFGSAKFGSAKLA